MAPASAPTSQSPIRLPLSPSKVRFNLPKSNSCSSFPIDLSDNDSTQSDSDSDDRVFFGSPKKGEEELVARLSKAVPATPRSRLKKRDSREFLRRKTILVTPPRRSQVQVDEEGDRSGSEVDEVSEVGMKKWPGGFHERRMSNDSHSSGSSSRSISPTPALYPETPGTRVTEDHCDLTLDFSRFRVSDSPLSNTRPTPTSRPSLLSGPNLQPEADKSDAESSGTGSEEEDEEEWSETEGEDSDKENAPAPYEHTGVEEDEEKEEYPLFQGPLTGSRTEPEDDLLRELDMGGLRLADFADPQMDFGTILLDTSYHSDFGFSSREPSEVGRGGHTRESTPIEDEQQTIKVVLVAVSPHNIPSIPNSTFLSSSPSLVESSPDLRQGSPSSSSSSDLDSPLPLSRGGPVIIPAYHSPILAESSSPFRSFSIREDLETSTPTQLASDTAAPLRFFSPSPTSASSTEVSSTPTDRTHIAQNATHQAKQPLRSSTLTSSLSTIPPPSASPLPLPIVQSTRALPEEEAAKRSEAIKMKLASVFAGKSLGLGKPQRSVSSSSQSSIASGSTSGPSRPGSRTGQVGVDVKGKGRLGDSTGTRSVKETRAAPTTSTITRKRNLPIPTVVASLSTSVTSSTSSRPVAASSSFSRRPPTVPMITSRPALVPRTLPPPAPPNRQSIKSQPSRSALPTSNTNGPTKLTRPPIAAKSTRVAQLSNMPILTCTQPLSATSPNSMSQSVPNTSNPLKRPMPFSNHPTTSVSRSAISTTGRTTLGLPSRVVGDQVFTLSSSRHMPAVSETIADEEEGTLGFESMPTFAIGVGGGGSTRSPGRVLGGGAVKGTPMSVRTNRFGTPARLMLGTPSRNLGLGTPSRLNRRAPGPTIQVYSTRPTTTTTSAPKDVASISASPSSGPPSTNTRHSETVPTSTADRGSSEDHEDVSFALPTLGSHSSEVGSSPLKTPQDSTEARVDIVNHDLRSSGRDLHPSKLISSSSSPIPSPTNTRPKRTIKAPAPRPVPIPKRPSVAAAMLSIAPNLSEKELKAKTSYNTAKNEKYHCAIEKQIVRVGTARPASPTSTIPTTEQREEEAKKRDREMRVKRRKGGKDVEEEEEDEGETLPVVRRLEGGEVDWKGDEEGWEQRPAKKQRIGSVGPEDKKGVKWDKGLVVIRDEGGPYNTGLKKVDGKKSALKSGKQVELDQHGNILPSRSKEVVKPLKIVVTVRLYEGEEPVVPISQATRGKKKA